MNLLIRLRFCLTGLVLLLGIAVRAAQPGATAPEGTGSATAKSSAIKQIDPKADALARKVGDFFSKLQTAQVEIDSTMTVQAKEMKQELPSKYRFSFQRPNLFALRLEDGAMGMDLVSDGRQMATYVPMLKKYTVTNSPAEISSAGSIGGPGMGPAPGNSMAFIGALFETNAYEKMMHGVVSGSYLGNEEMNGRPSEHVKFSQPDFSWEMWVNPGERPLIERIVVDLSPMMTKLGGEGKEAPPGMQEMFKDMKVLMRMNFANWKLNEPITPETFKFVPPVGAEKVASLMEMADAADDKEEPSPLLGKPAPALKLKTLKADSFDLASEKGKHVVILDFWATWCGPCVKALPVLLDVAKTYKEKGVAFYAVDQQEEAETIETFLKKQKMEVPVLLDKEGEVGQAYGVEGIPQTVMIDKQGVVQVVHIGYNPDMKKIISEQLDAILAGKPLPKE